MLANTNWKFNFVRYSDLDDEKENDKEDFDIPDTGLGMVTFLNQA